MRCPDEIAPTIIELISRGILRTRAAGWSGDAELCAIEADHLHNLPALLLNFSPGLLGFYWNVSRQSFMCTAREHATRKGMAADFGAFEEAWKLLERYLNQGSRKNDTQ